MPDPTSPVDPLNPAAAVFVSDLEFLRGQLLERAVAVARELAVSASQRDRQGGTAKRERDVIRASGLLNASIAKAQGGLGAEWTEVLDIVRLFARVDSSLAHVFGFQHLLLASVRLFGTEEQWALLHTATVNHRWFWGNALNPLEPTTTLSRVGKDFELNGTKSFSSGSVDADQLLISAIDAETGKLVVAVIPGHRKGLTALGDWDNMGQRQTDSGTVEFRRVVVSQDEILSNPGPLGNTFATLRPLIAQLTLTNVYIGLAEGALHEGRKYTLTSRRAWPNSSATSAREDPLILRRYGKLSVAIAAASALADRAAEALTVAYGLENTLTPEQRAQTALRVVKAKIAATEAALTTTAEIFDVTGARATASKVNLDRFWRNARTHTLHDPVDNKLTELGSFTLNHEFPKPTFYS